ncbi:hypothetical protein [Geomonas subterranea]|uniref:Uncharacterized protein n=1 Tax=Geomonas subterranea TaxID=2847989 RepID=A0ABX8LJR3_9BACT|nr:MULTISPECIES: hypothetical protein [Geomonas]QXE90473.1 hypothetical protein KP001_19020 [Geomonas subterranea]QXM11451.1 hypothetical protein KP002_10265 [Geomonas subterranea]
MDEYTFKSTGPDPTYLANVNIFFPVLFTLEIFKNGWPEHKFGSQSVLLSEADWFRQMYEGGRTGNRLHIAARKAARENLSARIQKILRYATVMADENDVKALLNSGVVIYKTRKKAHRTAKQAQP